MMKKKRLALLIPLIMLYAIPITNFAREWISPKNEGEIYRNGQTVVIHRTNNSLDRYHNVKIYFDGLDASRPNSVIINEKVFDETKEGECCCFGGTRFEYIVPCGYSGIFSIKIDHQRRRDVCIFGNWIDSGESERKFEVIPYIANAPIPEQYIACPGEDYTITLDNPDNMDGARWYSSLLEENYFRDGFSYTQKYDAALTDHYVSYYMRDGACITESARRVLAVISAPINGLIPPKTQFKTYCKKGNYRINLANPENYSGALWYDEFNAPTPIQDGLYLQRFFNDGSKIYYVQYYDDSNGCRQFSERIPIHVAVITQPSVSVEVDGINSFKIYDHRDVPTANCFDLNLYYYDLNDGIDEQQIRDEAQVYVNALVATLNNESPFTQMTSPNLRNYRWTPSDYYQVNAELRVCADNITNSQGTYGKNKYSYVADFDFTVAIYDINGNEIGREPRSCTLILRHKWVSNNPPGEILPTEACNPPSVETAQNLLSDQLRANCTTAEVRRICPDETITLGPSVPPVTALTYSWSPSTGLSNPNVIDPSIHYDDVPVQAYQIMKYTLTINDDLVGESEYCYYIYKCASCGPIDNTLHDLRNSTN